MARPLRIVKQKGVIGHTKVRKERGVYNVYECYEPKKYRKIAELTDYNETLPYRNLEFRKYAKVEVSKIPINKIGHTKVKKERHYYQVCKLGADGKYYNTIKLYKYADTLKYRGNQKHSNSAKYHDFCPIEHEKIQQSRVGVSKPKPKVIKTMDTMLKAKDKALEKIERNDNLVIKEKERPQKVRVQVDSKTSILVYPNQVENAITRYNKRYRQSQQQPCHTSRQSPNKGKKQSKNDTIYAY